MLFRSASVHICSSSDETDAITINAFNGGVDVYSNTNDIDLCAFNAAVHICSTGNQADAITINSINGGVDITSNGEHGDDIDITSINTSVHISSTENVTDAITLKSLDGGMILESKGDDIVICAIDADLRLKGDTVSIVNNDGDSLLNLDVILGIISDVVKTDYRAWIPYIRFVPGTYGVWLTRRDIISGTNTVYYWRKEPKVETAYISCDINETIRSTTDKGFKLKKLLFSYAIEGENITTIAPTITKRTYDETTPGIGFTATNIPFIGDDVNNNLTNPSGLSIGTHYRSVSVVTPDFINDESILTIELCLTTKASSIFKFYGMFIQFDQNHL